jgi:hypothetical protein
MSSLRVFNSCPSHVSIFVASMAPVYSIDTDVTASSCRTCRGARARHPAVRYGQHLIAPHRHSAYLVRVHLVRIVAPMRMPVSVRVPVSVPVSVRVRVPVPLVVLHLAAQPCAFNMADRVAQASEQIRPAQRVLLPNLFPHSSMFFRLNAPIPSSSATGTSA